MVVLSAASGTPKYCRKNGSCSSGFCSAGDGCRTAMLTTAGAVFRTSGARLAVGATLAAMGAVEAPIGLRRAMTPPITAATSNRSTRRNGREADWFGMTLEVPNALLRSLIMLVTTGQGGASQYDGQIGNFFS